MGLNLNFAGLALNGIYYKERNLNTTGVHIDIQQKGYIQKRLHGDAVQRVSEWNILPKPCTLRGNVINGKIHVARTIESDSVPHVLDFEAANVVDESVCGEEDELRPEDQ